MWREGGQSKAGDPEDSAVDSAAPGRAETMSIPSIPGGMTSTAETGCSPRTEIEACVKPAGIGGPVGIAAAGAAGVEIVRGGRGAERGRGRQRGRRSKRNQENLVGMNLLAREVGGVAPVRGTGAGRVTGRRSKGQGLVVRERRKG